MEREPKRGEWKEVLTWRVWASYGIESHSGARFSFPNSAPVFNAKSAAIDRQRIFLKMMDESIVIALLM